MHKADARGPSGEHHMTGADQLRSPSKGHPLDGCNHGKGGGMESIEEPTHGATHSKSGPLVQEVLAHRAQVSTAAEGLEPLPSQQEPPAGRPQEVVHMLGQGRIVTEPNRR